MSIYTQTFTDIEIILVRDGGCPVSPIHDPRLKFIDRDENKGFPYGLNQSLKIAKGEYVCYLGDDDIFYPNHVAALVKALDYSGAGAAYTDLYKVHYRTLRGQIDVMSKNVEISRDFDRCVMFEFNHVLHGSLMHRRDLIEKTGPYNEKISVLIDWDMTRRLCHYTDFVHVPFVTGEFWAEVGGGDRISKRERENEKKFAWNMQTIKSTRPPKPWIIDDITIVADRSLWPQIEQIVFWPHILVDKLDIMYDTEWVAYVEGPLQKADLESAMFHGGGQFKNGMIRRNETC